jgi:hypothetical protein
VIRSCSNNSAVKLVLLIPTSESINDKKLKSYTIFIYSWSDVKEINCSLSVSSEAFWLDRDIDVAPPDSLKRSSLTYLTSLVVSSKTTLFSLGVLPVFYPEDTLNAPVSVIVV